MSYYHRSAHDLSAVFEQPESFQSWLAENGSHFDVIIFETPPVLVDPQALVIARSAHVVLFAMRWKTTPKATSKSALEQLSEFSGPAIAGVLTKVDIKRHHHSGHRDSLYFYSRHIKQPLSPVT